MGTPNFSSLGEGSWRGEGSGGELSWGEVTWGEGTWGEAMVDSTARGRGLSTSMGLGVEVEEMGSVTVMGTLALGSIPEEALVTEGADATSLITTFGFSTEFGSTFTLFLVVASPEAIPLAAPVTAEDSAIASFDCEACEDGDFFFLCFT